MQHTEIAFPSPVMGLYDKPFWDSIQNGRCALQQCSACGAFRYPPGPVCAACLSTEHAWTPLSGRGTILSWVRFHKQYLPAFPAPYEVIAVRIEEGPVMISNLDGPAPEGDWIGRQVRMTYHRRPDGFVLPRFVLDDAGSPQ